MDNWYEYEVYLSLGYVGSDRTDSVDLRDYGVTKEQWETMNADERESWLEENLEEEVEYLQDNFLTNGWRKVGEDE